MRNGVKQESSTLHNFIIKFFTGLKKRSNALPQALETLYPILQKIMKKIMWQSHQDPTAGLKDLDIIVKGLHDTILKEENILVFHTQRMLFMERVRR